MKTRLTCRMTVLVLGNVVFLALLCFCFRLKVVINRDFYSKLTVNWRSINGFDCLHAGDIGSYCVDSLK